MKHYRISKNNDTRFVGFMRINDDVTDYLLGTNNAWTLEKPDFESKLKLSTPPMGIDCIKKDY
jgi:hypothetical protein